MRSKRYRLAHLAFLQGFEAAARALSFTKAAEELFITQSAVSRQIKALEDSLGLKLFERRPRSLTLTENGQALYRIATDVLDRLRKTPKQYRYNVQHVRNRLIFFTLARIAAARRHRRRRLRRIVGG